MAGSNSLDLAVIPTSYNNTINSLSGNKNAQSVGGALDKMVLASQAGTSTTAQDQLLYATAGQSAASLSSYAQSLAGEVYAATVAVIAQTTQRVQQAVLTRLGDTMGLGLPQSLISPNTALMNTTNTALSGSVTNSAVGTNPNANLSTGMTSLNNGNVWGELAYQKGNRSSDSNSGGWNSNLYQLVFGADFTPMMALNSVAVLRSPIRTCIPRMARVRSSKDRSLLTASCRLMLTSWMPWQALVSTPVTCHGVISRI